MKNRPGSLVNRILEKTGAKCRKLRKHITQTWGTKKVCKRGTKEQYRTESVKIFLKPA